MANEFRFDMPSSQQPPPVQTADDKDRRVAAPLSTDHQLNALSSMLGDLEESAATPKIQSQARPHENRLVQVRLGVASALFASLRAKHPASAAHSLRVAMGCSAWTLALELEEEVRDEIEVAALLHDIGKIGVPDYLLTKAGGLEPEDRERMQQHRSIGIDILSNCCASTSLIETLKYAPAWFNGEHGEFDRTGDELPLGSRVLAIVDAFDSMTTDNVWRRALSRERALSELFKYAGTQFDPDLVKHYGMLQVSDQSKLQARVARRWLQEIAAQNSDKLWENQSPAAAAPVGTVGPGAWFHSMLIDNMHDAVIFVDNELKITQWNNGAARMTGKSQESVTGRGWLPRLIEMCDPASQMIIADEACPVKQVINTGVQQMRRLAITGRSNDVVAVNAHFMPVVSNRGVTQGAVILLKDASSESTLEEQIHSLNERATMDPLTKVANRAEFDKMHEQFVVTHLEKNRPCALVMCDIDHFKKINDTYGHQAGDDALVSYAALLKRSCRPGDVVARYGGEEFVLLCTDCDNATATSRAEKIRAEVAATTHASLNNRSFTSSFGVTEIQPGDTPETMLRRADRALYEAKEMGRNMVVQLGSGLSGEGEAEKSSFWGSWFGGSNRERGQKNQLVATKLIAGVPLKIIAEKLRGFVADQEATISDVADDRLTLTIDGDAVPLKRRSSDRAVAFIVQLKFDEREVTSESTRGATVKTMIEVVICTKYGRDRRQKDAMERARQMVSSLKSYLVAQDFVPSD